MRESREEQNTRDYGLYCASSANATLKQKVPVDYAFIWSKSRAIESVDLIFDIVVIYVWYMLTIKLTDPSARGRN